jgi:hypothetical protein
MFVEAIYISEASRRRALVFATVLVAMACASESGQCRRAESVFPMARPALASAAPRPAVGRTTADELPKPGPPAIHVLDVGQAPYETLRLRVFPGTTQRLRIEVRSEVAMTVGDMKLPAVTLPAVVATVTIHTRQNAPEVRYHLTIDEVALAQQSSPELAGALHKTVAALAGGAGDVVMSFRGITRSYAFDLDVADGKSPALKQAWQVVGRWLVALSMPLPEEPVGVGAQWEAVQAIERAGKVVIERTVYDLHARDGATLSVKVTLDQGAPAQPLSPAVLPAGINARLVAYNASGGGQIRSHLQRIGPLETELTTTSRAQFVSMVRGESQPLALETVVRITGRDTEIVP